MPGPGVGHRCLAVVLLVPLAACVALLPYLASLQAAQQGELGRWPHPGLGSRDALPRGQPVRRDSPPATGAVTAEIGAIVRRHGQQLRAAAKGARRPEAEGDGVDAAGTGCVEGFTKLLAGGGGSFRCAACPRGQFSLPAGAPPALPLDCRPHLSCADISAAVVDRQPFTDGGVKKLYRATWLGRPVVYSRGKVLADFQHGIDMLVSLAPHPAVVTPIGVCREQLELVTPYYRHGSADQFSKVLARVAAEPDAYKEAYQAPCNHPASLFGLRVRWMAQYARAIVYLHNSPRGVRVMCDGDHVSKLLSQFLVTDDLRFVLNDLDALPETGPGRKIKCGHRQFPGGSFVAPEQLWPHKDLPFSDKAMPGYDEKVDVWRMPDVLERLAGDLPPSCRGAVQPVLAQIRRRCKVRQPRQRPTAMEVAALVDSLARRSWRCECIGLQLSGNEGGR